MLGVGKAAPAQILRSAPNLRRTRAAAPVGRFLFIENLHGLVSTLRGGFLFKRLKRNQKIAGDNAENILFSMAFSPDPLLRGL